MRNTSTKTKNKQERGTGIGPDYKPWIKVREFNSQGCAANVRDYKHGRTMELLSRGELYAYYILRFRDDVIDIREQFPLDMSIIWQICSDLHIRFIGSEEHVLTSDLVVETITGDLEVYNIKPTRDVFKNKRMNEKRVVEETYWKMKNASYHVIYTDEINQTLALNIMEVVRCYDKKYIQDKIGAIKHLIATKKLKVDLKSKPLDYQEILRAIERKELGYESIR